jgi:hypothetical protein
MEEFIMKNVNVKEEVRRKYYECMTTFEFCAKCAKDAYRSGNEKHYKFYVKKANEALMKIEILESLK